MHSGNVGREGGRDGRAHTHTHSPPRQTTPTPPRAPRSPRSPGSFERRRARARVSPRVARHSGAQQPPRRVLRAGFPGGGGGGCLARTRLMTAPKAKGLALKKQKSPFRTCRGTGQGVVSVSCQRRAGVVSEVGAGGEPGQRGRSGRAPRGGGAPRRGGSPCGAPRPAPWRRARPVPAGCRRALRPPAARQRRAREPAQ